MDERQFEQDLNSLHLLGQDEQNLDAFCDFGLKMLTQIYNQMMRVANSDKVLSGQFRAQGEMVKAIVQLKLESLNLEWPERQKKG
jgi:hypothetical protein